MKGQDKRLRRALYLVPYITRFGDQGISLSQLADEVGVTTAVLRKELLKLLMVGVPDGTDSVNVFIDGKGDRARVSVMPCRLLQRPPRLTTQEALALLIGAETVKSTGFPPYDAAIERATAKIRQVFRKQDSDEDGQGRSGEAAVNPGTIILATAGARNRATMAALAQACREHRAVELDYASLSSQRRKSIRIEPYGLLNHCGDWYVLGHSLTHAENRVFVFKVERILGVEVLAATFTLPKHFDIRAYQGHSMFVTNWNPVQVTLRLTAAAAGRLQGQMPEGKPQRDGSRLVSFKSPITGWLAAWVLRQGDGVEVVGPRMLRDWVANLAARVAAGHG